MNEGWTVIEVAKSAWASTRLQEPWAITLEPGQYRSLEIKFHTLAQVLDMAMSADLGPSESRSLPWQVSTWMFSLGLAPLDTIDRATRSLSREQNLDILAGWFNGGGGLPAQEPEPGKHGERTRLNLGHPALLTQFLRWVIRYWALHETVDGRVDRDCERMINLARELQDEAPVRRY